MEEVEIEVEVVEVDEVDEVEVNIFVCVSVKIGQNCTFSLFFSQNWPEKCNTCVLLLFSARQVSAVQAKKWRDAHYTSNPQPPVGKIIQVRYPCIVTDKIFQHTQATILLIQKLPFSRLVCEIAQDYKTDLKFTATAILALHHVSEYFLMEVTEKTHLAALCHKRIMISPKDMHLVKAFTHMW